MNVDPPKPFIRTADRPCIELVADLVVTNADGSEKSYPLTARQALLFSSKLMAGMQWAMPDLDNYKQAGGG